MRRSLVLFAGAAFAAQVAHYDSGQTNWNPQESILTPAAIARPGFGRLGSYQVDGFIFAQPLYVPAVSIAGRTVNALIVATLANSVYAFDADRPNSAPLWRTNFGPVRTSYSGCCGGDLFFYTAGLGIVSTPAVDPVAGRVYVTNTNPTPSWVLSVLNLSTGAVLNSTTITGQFPGSGDTGDTVVSGMLQFKPAQELQRPGLALANGRVYVAFGGVGDNRPWHGWVFAFNTSDLSAAGVFCTTPSSFGGAVWQSGAAPSVDASGNVYVTTGNDNGNPDSAEYGESVLKLSPTLSLLDWFTPSNFSSLDSLDADVSSGWPLLIPGTNLAVVAAKDFNVYVLNTSCMGHLQGSTSCALQTFKTNAAGVPADMTGSYGAASANGILYLPTTAGSMYAFQLSGGTFATTPIAVSSNTYGYPGPSQMAVSSNGPANGILWVTTGPASSFTSTQPGTLRALDPVTLAPIWNSSTNPRDTLGTLAKFVSPTVAGGRVYVATQDGRVQVYGLIPSASVRGRAVLRGASAIR